MRRSITQQASFDEFALSMGLYHPSLTTLFVALGTLGTRLPAIQGQERDPPFDLRLHQENGIITRLDLLALLALLAAESLADKRLLMPDEEASFLSQQSLRERHLPLRCTSASAES